MISALAVVSPAHVVVGTSESSLALVTLPEDQNEGFEGRGDETGSRKGESEGQKKGANQGSIESSAGRKKTQSGRKTEAHSPQGKPRSRLRDTNPTSFSHNLGKTVSVSIVSSFSYFPRKCSSSPVLDLAFNESTSSVFAAAGSTVSLWDVSRSARTSLAQITLPDSALACTWLSPHLVVSAGAACGVSFWDTRSGARKVYFAKVASDNLYSLVGDENGLFAAGADGKVHCVDLRRGEHTELDFGSLGAVVGMDVAASLAVVFESGAVRVAAKSGSEKSVEPEFCGAVSAAKSKVGCGWGEAGLAVGSENGVVTVFGEKREREEMVVGEGSVPCVAFCGGRWVGSAGGSVWSRTNW